MDITIRCLGCQATTAVGGLASLPSQDDALKLAQHNPGCPINRADHRVMVHSEEVTTMRAEEVDGEMKPIEEKKTVYSVIVFPAYRD